MMLKWLSFMMRPGEEAARVDNIWIIPMEKGTGNVTLGGTGGGMTSMKQGQGQRWLGPKSDYTHRWVGGMILREETNADHKLG